MEMPHPDSSSVKRFFRSRCWDGVGVNKDSALLRVAAQRDLRARNRRIQALALQVSLAQWARVEKWSMHAGSTYIYDVFCPGVNDTVLCES